MWACRLRAAEQAVRFQAKLYWLRGALATPRRPIPGLFSNVDAMNAMRSEEVPGHDAGRAPPRVWLVTAYRAGEREQILALAEALRWPYEIKQVAHRPWAWRVNLLRGSDLSGIDRAQSSPLEPPWPDLVIGAGMRNEPVCRWIRAQSGVRTRIVHIGRPWARPDNFDLVVTTPQYRLAEHPKVLQNTTTLHRVADERLRSEAERFRPKLADLPAPYLAVVVGGDSGPYTLGVRAAERLAIETNALADRLGASLLVTTSSRTHADAAETLSRWLRAPKYFHKWKPDDADNPYFAFLALADAIIVTADSISMLTEACATCKPVYMFDIGAGSTAMRNDSPVDGSDKDFRLKSELYRGMMRVGPRRLSRDIRLVHEKLIEAGRAVWLGQEFPEGALSALPDLERAVERVRALFE